MSPHAANDTEVGRNDVEEIKRFLAANPDMTALISSEFSVTQLIVSTLREMKKSIPEDYSLVMFDSYESVTLPLFTHVYQEEIGRIAFETLLAYIANKVVGTKIYVPFKIVEGNSVKTVL